MAGKKILYLCTILCSIVVTSLISDVTAKAYKPSHSSHSYPSSHGGLSGSHSSGSHSMHSSHSYPTHSSMGSSNVVTQHKYPSSHSYPSSGSSLSGGSSGSSHSYPSSNSLSGSSGGHSYPSPSGTAHGYPSSNSLSGGGSSSVHSYPSTGGSSAVHSYPSTGGSSAVHSYPSTGGSNAHGYPSSNSLSGTGTKPGAASYPASPGLSGGTNYPSGSSSYPHHTNPNNNIHHSTSWGSKPVHHTSSHTVVHHHYNYRPPSVINYHTSSGYVHYPVYSGPLPPYVYEYRSSGNKYSYLLAGLALYNLGKMSSDHRFQSYHKSYVPQPDEYCKFGVRYRSGVTEEMSVDCRSITYFIYQENQPGSLLSSEMNKNLQQANAIVGTNTQQLLSSTGELLQPAQPINTITTTTTSTYSVTDPRFYGNPIDVRPDMECYVSRVARFSNIVKPVPCDLLQSYSKQSLYRVNSAPGLKSSLVAMVVAIAVLMY